MVIKIDISDMARQAASAVLTNVPAATPNPNNINSNAPAPGAPGGTSSINVPPPASSAGVESGVPAASGAATDNAQAPGLQTTVAEVNNKLSSLGTGINMVVDEEANIVIVKIIDQETGEVIKQIPAEEMVNVSKRLAEVIDSYAKASKNAISLFEELS